MNFDIDYSNLVVGFGLSFWLGRFLSQSLELEKRYPAINSIIKFLWLWVIIFFVVAAQIKATHIDEYFLEIGLLFILYIIYISKEHSLYRTMLVTFLPFAVILFIYDFFLNLTPNFFKLNRETFEALKGFGIFWVIGFSIYAQRQAKRELVQRKKDEEERRLLEAKKDALEYQVAERTAELTQKNEELKQSINELKTTQNQLVHAEKMASLGELTAGIAHEIQNPLNFVNNFSEVSVELCQEITEELEKSPLTPDGGIILSKENKEFLTEILSDLSQNQQKITHHGQRAASIVRGMLQHSRTSTGQKELTDINALADEYLRLSYHGLRAKDKTFNADFKTDFQADLPKIAIIPQDFGRVILNILNNAFYAVQQRAKQGIEGFSPKVIVSTQKIDNQIIIKIKDNGLGMSEATKSKIFQPFFTTKPTGQGTGLGLSLAYDIITKGHGGTLEVESLEGEGTTFTIQIPIN